MHGARAVSRESSLGVGALLAGKYRIEALLGEGGMALVLLATQVELERLVAIKLLRYEYAKNQQMAERMLTEARAVARLRSEHVVRVLDVGSLASGLPYIVMEYLEGRDLAVHVRERRRLDVDEAVDYVLQASEALAEAHCAGIVHRDLKPENLFLTAAADGAPCIKLLDFGICQDGAGAWCTGRFGADQVFVGSPQYMAPEQMRADREVDARADIWALGAILFELLTGEQAFGGSSLAEVCGRVLQRDPPRLGDYRPELPPELTQIVSRCLRRDPGERFATTSELGEVLAPFAQDGGARSSRISRVALTARTRMTPVSCRDLPRLDVPSTRPAPSRARGTAVSEPRVVAWLRMALGLEPASVARNG